MVRTINFTSPRKLDQREISGVFSAAFIVYRETMSIFILLLNDDDHFELSRKELEKLPYKPPAKHISMILSN